jgi:hypothetical protein
MPECKPPSREVIEKALAGRVPSNEEGLEDFFKEHTLDCHQCALAALNGTPRCDGWRMYATQPKFHKDPYSPRLWQSWAWSYIPGTYDLVFSAKAYSSHWIEVVKDDGHFGHVVYHSYSDCE